MNSVTTTEYSWMDGALHADALLQFCDRRAELWKRHSTALGRVAAAVAEMQRAGDTDSDVFTSAMQEALAAQEFAAQCRRMAKAHEQEHGCGPSLG